jgi:hypothetical protein
VTGGWNMQIFRIISVCFAIVFGVVSCVYNADDDLTFIPDAYTGNELKIEGYYYRIDAYGYHSTYFFFLNGVMLDGGGVGGGVKLADWENEVRNGQLHEFAIALKHHWGVFIVKNKLIAFEKWVPRNGGDEVTKAYRYSGEILNDTTFRIVSTERVDGSNSQIVDWVFHFKQFTPKPDSTNSFIP